MPTPDIKSDDYYKVLGVDRTASDNDIAKAYKKLALKHHPDKNPDNKEAAEENFKALTEAYEVLRDADKRKTYDQIGKQGMSGGAGGASGASGASGAGGGMSFQHADDLFRTLFGGNDPFSGFLDKDLDDFAFFSGAGMPGGTRGQFSGGGMPGFGGMGNIFGMAGDRGGFPGMMGGMGGMGKGASKGKRAQSAPGVSKKRAQPAPPQHAMPIGTKVVIRGLSRAQEHNGKQGRVTGFDQARGRYEVELEDDSTLQVKPTNLTQQCSVHLRGIESQPGLNGQEGTILSYNEDGGRYNVKLKEKMSNGRDVVGLEPGKFILDKGTRVTTQNLSNESYNGLMARITEFDPEALRYSVWTETGKAMKIKLDNVLC